MLVVALAVASGSAPFAHLHAERHTHPAVQPDTPHSHPHHQPHGERAGHWHVAAPAETAATRADEAPPPETPAIAVATVAEDPTALEVEATLPRVAGLTHPLAPDGQVLDPPPPAPDPPPPGPSRARGPPTSLPLVS